MLMEIAELRSSLNAVKNRLYILCKFMETQKDRDQIKYDTEKLPTRYSGKSMEFWAEIIERLNKALGEEDVFDKERLLQEVAFLRGKVSLYEKYIKEARDFLDFKEDI